MKNSYSEFCYQTDTKLFRTKKKKNWFLLFNKQIFFRLKILTVSRWYDTNNLSSCIECYFTSAMLLSTLSPRIKTTVKLANRFLFHLRVGSFLPARGKFEQILKMPLSVLALYKGNLNELTQFDLCGFYSWLLFKSEKILANIISSVAKSELLFVFRKS